MRKRKRATVLVGTLLATLAVAIPFAAAEAQPGQVVDVNSNLWLAGSGAQGTVRAGNGNCVEDRRILVKAKGQGVVMRATTDANGFWKVDRSVLLAKVSSPSQVYAVAPQVTQGTAGPIYRCLMATSRTVTVSAQAGQVITLPSNVWIAAVASQGRVRAASANCVGDRKVLIKKNGFGTVMSTTTNASGFWSVDRAELYTATELPAKLYAVVPQITQGTAGPIYRCLKGVSQTVEVP